MALRRLPLLWRLRRSPKVELLDALDVVICDNVVSLSPRRPEHGITKDQQRALERVSNVRRKHVEHFAADHVQPERLEWLLLQLGNDLVFGHPFSFCES